MPRVSYLHTKSTRLNDAYKQMNHLAELIQGKRRTQEEIAKAMGISAPTLRKKLKHPETFTLKELMKFCSTYDTQGGISFHNGATTTDINW